MIIIIIIIVGTLYLYNRYSFIKVKKNTRSKFTTIIHTEKDDIELLHKIKNYFNGKVIILRNYKTSDITFLAYIIKYWSNMPEYCIFLRDNDIENRKEIIQCLNGIDRIWGEKKYMNLEDYLKYILIVKSGDETLGNDINTQNIIKTIKKQSVGLYQNFNYEMLQKGDFKIFWDIYFLPYFGELHNNIPKIINIHKQSTTGQFIVYYKQFYWRPKEFYINLFDYLKGGGRNYLPILWDTILS